MRRAMSGVLSDEVGESGDAEVDDGVVFAVAVDGFGDGGFGGVDGLLALACGDEGVCVARRRRGHWGTSAQSPSLLKPLSFERLGGSPLCSRTCHPTFTL